MPYSFYALTFNLYNLN